MVRDIAIRNRAAPLVLQPDFVIWLVRV